MTDNINPSHYRDSEIECIDAIKASSSPKIFGVVNTINILDCGRNQLSLKALTIYITIVSASA